MNLSTITTDQAIANDAIRVYQAYLTLELAAIKGTADHELELTARLRWNQCAIRHGGDVSRIAKELAERFVKDMYPVIDPIEYAY